jgi:hypothetical protein
MKKLLFILAACTISAAALAQPMRGPDRPFKERHHHHHKVWVPAHREGRHFVRGHYTWR